MLHLYSDFIYATTLFLFSVLQNPSLLGTYFINDTSNISNGKRSYSNTTDPSEMITVTVTIITPTLPLSMTPPPPITPPADALFNFLPLLLSVPQPGLISNLCMLDFIGCSWRFWFSGKNDELLSLCSLLCLGVLLSHVYSLDIK